MFTLGIVMLIIGPRFIKDAQFYAVVLVISGSLMLLWRTVKQSRERLNLISDVERLRAALTSLQDGSEGRIEVPADLLEKVASIEQAQIARERATAVAAGVSAASTGYGVLLARDASHKKASLPPDLRLDVEELIEELAAAGEHGQGLRKARTPDGTAEVDYRVDQSNRCIHVVEIRTSHSHAY